MKGQTTMYSGDEYYSDEITSPTMRPNTLRPLAREDEHPRNWYYMPIAERVSSFLEQHSHTNQWYTIRAIAGSTHLEGWQVAEQLTPLVANDDVIEDGERGQTYYRWNTDEEI